jgi:phosphate-selective porin OprO/OprP
LRYIPLNATRTLNSRVWLSAVVLGLSWLVADAQESPIVDFPEAVVAALPPAPLVVAEVPSVEDVAPETSLIRELEVLRRRLESVEQGQAQRKKDDAAKKAADASKPTVKWTGQVQADFLTFNQSPESEAAYGDIENGAVFRRARFGMFGDYGPTEYRIETDFALSGRPRFLDMFLGVRDVPGLGRIRVGHFFEPFSLERVTPNRFVTFAERSLIDQPFAPARNLGIMAQNTFLEQRGTIAYGYFRTASDDFGDDVGDNFESAVTGRVTWLPYYDDACQGRNYVHLGAGYSFRGANAEQVRFRAQPEALLGATSPDVPFFVDTGNIPADSFQHLGAEAVWTHGPWSVQGEYVVTPVDSKNEGTLWFQGGYVQGSWFLTGEHRPYRRDIGVLDRVIPFCDAVRHAHDKSLQTGPGAWELALRLSHLDLNNETRQGGRITNLTAGLNWYLNPYLRVTANYIHAFADHPTVGDTDTDIFITRFGYDF